MKATVDPVAPTRWVTHADRISDLALSCATGPRELALVSDLLTAGGSTTWSAAELGGRPHCAPVCRCSKRCETASRRLNALEQRLLAVGLRVHRPDHTARLRIDTAPMPQDAELYIVGHDSESASRARRVAGGYRQLAAINRALDWHGNPEWEPAALEGRGSYRNEAAARTAFQSLCERLVLADLVAVTQVTSTGARWTRLAHFDLAAALTYQCDMTGLDALIAASEIANRDLAP